jgi:hypothetical protein
MGLHDLSLHRDEALAYVASLNTETFRKVRVNLSDAQAARLGQLCASDNLPLYRALAAALYCASQNGSAVRRLNSTGGTK